MVDKIAGGIAETIRAMKAAEGTAERENQPPSAIRTKLLRITADDVLRWVEIGERCARLYFHYQETEKEEDAL